MTPGPFAPVPLPPPYLSPALPPQAASTCPHSLGLVFPTSASCPPCCPSTTALFKGLHSRPQKKEASQSVVFHCLGECPSSSPLRIGGPEEEWSLSSPLEIPRNPQAPPDTKRSKLDLVTVGGVEEGERRGSSPPPSQARLGAAEGRRLRRGPSSCGHRLLLRATPLRHSQRPRSLSEVLRLRGGASTPRAQPATVAASSRFLGRRASPAHSASLPPCPSKTAESLGAANLHETPHPSLLLSGMPGETLQAQGSFQPGESLQPMGEAWGWQGGEPWPSGAEQSSCLSSLSPACQTQR